MNGLLRNIAIGLLRHALTYGGGSLVSAGLMSSSDSEQAVGAILTIVGLGWSAYQKWQEKSAAKASAASDVIDAAVTQAKAASARIETQPLPPIQ